MPITPFLAGQAFDPETIENMSAALIEACDAFSCELATIRRRDLSPRKSSNGRSAASAIPICFGN